MKNRGCYIYNTRFFFMILYKISNVRNTVEMQGFDFFVFVIGTN